MTITTIIIHNSICLVNENQGSSFALPAHGWVGARATSSLAAHFALRNTASNSAEKKGSPSKGVAEGGGWGEGISARLFCAIGAGWEAFPPSWYQDIKAKQFSIPFKKNLAGGR